MTDEEIEEILMSSSVPLMKLDSENKLLEIASGCLIDFESCRLLLTVAHAVRQRPPMRMEIQWDEQKGMENCILNPNIPFEFLLNPEIDNLKMYDLDFAYQKLPTGTVPLLQKLDHSGNGKILSSRPRTIYSEAAIQIPKTNTLYGFAGRTKPKPEDHPGMTVVEMTLQCCYGLTLVGEAHGLHAFQLPNKHPGHDYFRGCSGAPIVDMAGNVVALVCRGCEEESIIYGFPIARYKSLLEIEALSLVK